MNRSVGLKGPAPAPLPPGCVSAPPRNPLRASLSIRWPTSFSSSSSSSAASTWVRNGSRWAASSASARSAAGTAASGNRATSRCSSARGSASMIRRLPRYPWPDRPETISGSDHGPGPGSAPGLADASRPAPAQRRGERLVVLGQSCHLPVEPLELPPQGLVLRGLLLETLPQVSCSRPARSFAASR